MIRICPICKLKFETTMAKKRCLRLSCQQNMAKQAQQARQAKFRHRNREKLRLKDLARHKRNRTQIKGIDINEAKTVDETGVV